MDKLARAHVLVCGGTGCSSSGSKLIIPELREKLRRFGMEDEVKVVETGCHGLCEMGPLVIVYPEGVFYVRVHPKDVDDIVETHLLKGSVVERLLFREPATNETVAGYDDIAFYKHQKRYALKNCGHIDPESIEEYIGADGYEGLIKVLSMKPEDVIEEIKASGLRGRGGAGFPTGMKWQFTRAATSDQKYVICNADEGDPGAFMDRSVLEGDPHRVLEGMAICGYAIGSDEGYIYCRAEYPLAIKRLRIAIAQAELSGLLGVDIMGSGFSFNIHIKEGAGAFVCGEETALIASIEGRRGMPRPRPPFPANSGLWGKPTNINNVETFANVPSIMRDGAGYFASQGTETSKGTKVFALTGKINNTGLAEVPMGITMRKIIYDIGGGVPNGRNFKAVQIGGPSGGCLPEGMLDLSIDYESLTKAGAMMGSGGLVVMDDTTCMVDMARYFLNFTQDESCGKCTPCREGTKRMLEILNRICSGDGKDEDIPLLETLAKSIKAASLCALGQTAPNPVLSTLRFFRDEYEAHIRDHRCPAGACAALIGYLITDSCRGCGLCKKVCPADAITGEMKGMHKIDPEKCVKCGACYDKCPFKAIDKG
ncbi:MAG: NADH-quinone oxidoreductase subunit NuoF [Synergistaceae bacterium]|nr:NADH-quinone oxidoreductase subunit NuoF [Synergistaceae bacterium]